MSKIKSFFEAISSGERFDGWYNSITGLGTASRDKNQGMAFGATARLSDIELAQMYAGDDMAAKIIDSIPEGAFRKLASVKTSSSSMDADAQAKAVSLIKEQLAALGAHELLYEAATWGRLYGGGVAIIGADDGGAMDVPLVEGRVRSIRFLDVLDKRDLMPIMTAAGAYAGTPELYRIQTMESGLAQDEIIHSSRMLMFGGVLTSKRDKRANNSWDHSVLERVKGALSRFASDWASVSAMLSDCSQGILKIEGFHQLLSQGLKDAFQTRLDVMDVARFVGRIMPIDTTEDYSYVERSFAGVPALLDRTMFRLSAATGIPVTVLFGRSPAGMNATGESDLTNWYDVLESHQTRKYGASYSKLVRLVAHAVGALEPETWEVDWPSLWSESPEEAAISRKTMAETDAIYVNAGIVDPDELASVRFAAGEYTTMAPAIDTELREPFKEDLRSPDVDSSNGLDEQKQALGDNIPPQSPVEGSRQDASERWRAMVPPVILDDLETLDGLIGTKMPPEVIRPVFIRLASNLGVATDEVIADIEGRALFYAMWEETKYDMRGIRYDADAMKVPPIVVTYIVAFEMLLKHQFAAPDSMLRMLAHRIASGLGVATDEVRQAIDGVESWNTVEDVINAAPKPQQAPSVQITIATSCDGTTDANQE